MKLWAQIDPAVGAPLTPNKQTMVVGIRQCVVQGCVDS